MVRMRIAAAGGIRGDRDEAFDAGANGGVEQMDGAVAIDLVKLTNAPRMNDAGRVKQDCALGVLTKALAVPAIANIAENYFHVRGKRLQGGDILSGQDQTTNAPVGGRCREGFVLPQPPRE